MPSMINDPMDRFIYEWAARIEEGKESFYEGPPMGSDAMRKMNAWEGDMVENFRLEAEAKFPGKADEMESKLMSILEKPRFASSWEKVVEAMLDVADVADEAGRYEEADKIASLVHKASVVKVAQYEGGQNYWLLNQRAFERAWRIKRQKAGLSQAAPITPDDFRSAQECWLEVLEEYQDALLGNDADMLSKYAAKKKPKPATDTAAEMSENMTAFHDQMDEEAKSKGVSAGEFIAKKFGPKGAAMGKEFLAKVSERLMEGSTPGVAFYEAMDYFTSGQYAREVVANALDRARRLAFVLDEVEEEVQPGVEAPALPKEDKVRRLEDQLRSLKNAISVFEEELERLYGENYPKPSLGKPVDIVPSARPDIPSPSIGFES